MHILFMNYAAELRILFQHTKHIIINLTPRSLKWDTGDK